MAPPRGSVDARQIFFNWSFLIPLVTTLLTFGMAYERIGRNTEEINLLRTKYEKLVENNQRIAETMATRTDVQIVSEQVRALAAELRLRSTEK